MIQFNELEAKSFVLSDDNNLVHFPFIVKDSNVAYPHCLNKNS